MGAALVLDIVGRLEARGIPVWLDGGWAVDALLREQTRPHDDLDLVARLDDGPLIVRALGELGYAPAGGGAPRSYELVDQDGHQVDVHPVAWAASGDGVYKQDSGEDWIYPADGFLGIGRILEHDVPCLTPEVVIVNHTTGYVLDDVHQRDARLLAERYGIPLTESRTA